MPGHNALVGLSLPDAFSVRLAYPLITADESSEPNGFRSRKCGVPAGSMLHRFDGCAILSYFCTEILRRRLKSPSILPVLSTTQLRGSSASETGSPVSCRIRTTWPTPSLARAKGTWLGALDLGHFLPPPIRIDEKDCQVHTEFPKMLQKPMEELVDAFLYLGPQDLRLSEKIPADIALDASYKAEFQRGGVMFGFPDAASETSQEFDQQIVRSAENPSFRYQSRRTIQSLLNVRSKNA